MVYHTDFSLVKSSVKKKHNFFCMQFYCEVENEVTDLITADALTEFNAEIQPKLGRECESVTSIIQMTKLTM